jgi:hypothetical protein
MIPSQLSWGVNQQHSHMNATNTPSGGVRLKPSGIERALGFLDLAIGIAILGYCLLGVISAFRPSSAARDNAIFGFIGLALLLPFGIAAFAAFDAMRSRAAGRWVLQTLALVPLLIIGSVVVWARFAHAG